MIIKVDRDSCIGCGLCASTCHEVFKVSTGSDTSTCHEVFKVSTGSDRCEILLKTPRVPKSLEEVVSRAIDECPVSALSRE